MLVGAFSVITNLWMELFEALDKIHHGTIPRLVTATPPHDSSPISRFALQLNCLHYSIVFIFFYDGYKCAQAACTQLVQLEIRQVNGKSHSPSSALFEFESYVHLRFLAFSKLLNGSFVSLWEILAGGRKFAF